MSMDLSLHHLPEPSDATMDVSDSSFQIPAASSSSSDLLLADDSTDFFQGMNDTFATPAAIPGRVFKQPDLTLEELTPRSKSSRTQPLRPFPKARPVIPSPLKRAVAHDLSTAIEEALSPLKSNELSFAIPRLGAEVNELLLAETSDFLKSGGAEISITDELPSTPTQDTLTLSQLSPAPRPLRRSFSRTPESVPTSLPPAEESPSLVQATDQVTASSPSSDTTVQIPESRQEQLDSEHDDEPLSQSEDNVHTPLVEAPLLEDADPLVPARAPEDSAHHPDPPETGQHMAVPVEHSQVSKRTTEKAKLKVQPKRTVIEGKTSKRVPVKPASSVASRPITKPDKKPNSRTQPLRTRKNATDTNKSSSAKNQSSTTNKKDSASASEIIEPNSLPATLLSHGQRDQEASTQSVQVQDIAMDDVREVEPEMVPSDPIPQDNDEMMQIDSEPEYSKTQTTITQPGEDKLGIISDETVTQSSMAADNLCASPIEPCGPDAVPIPETSNIHSDSLPPVSNVSDTNRTPDDYTIDKDTAAGPSSSMRASRKRSASAEPSLDEGRRKKVKIAPAPTNNSGSTSQKPATRLNTSTTRRAGSRVLQRSRVRNGAPATRSTNITKASLRSSRNTRNTSDKAGSTQELSTSLADSHTSHVKEVNLIDKPRQLTASNPPSDRSKSAPKSTAGRSGDQQRGSLEIQRGGLTVPHGTRNTLSSSDSRLVQGSKRTLYESSRMNASVSSHKLTKPIEFHFHSDARIEARKSEAEDQARASQRRSVRADQDGRHHPVPDFKAIHAAQEAEQAARREQIVPIVPIPIEFHTDLRAEERQKFETARRAREEEAERQAEEQRRQQALEEEEEIRVLRKRAIPKANPIPDWYAAAPKRNRENKLGASVSK